jgi:ABC-2 type transport system ATP-binding protein
MTVSAVVTAGLTKDYGAGRGIFDLDLEVGRGEVFGFLGPNGAGKTTTIRLLMGLARATRGSAAIYGLDSWKQSVAVKRRVAYLPGELPQFGGLRGKEVIAYLAGLRGGGDPARVAELCERFDLDLGRRYREYSRGNKQKLALVLVFMGHPELLILDEPTSGLDPLNQQVFHALVGEVREAGATVFLSSHVLSEVEHICDHVGIVRAGRLVKVASLEELHEIRVHHVEVEIDGDRPLDALRAAGVEQLASENGRVSFVVRGSFAPVMAALGDAHVANLTSREPSLEEAFLTYYEEDGSAERPEDRSADEPEKIRR